MKLRGIAMGVEIVSLVTVLFIAFYILIRNAIVFRVRTEILWNGGIRNGKYDALPSYDSMMINPRHMFRVTTAQWVEYADAMLRDRAK